MNNLAKRGTAKEYRQPQPPYNGISSGKGAAVMGDGKRRSSGDPQITLTKQQAKQIESCIKKGVYKQLCARGIITERQLQILLTED